MLAFAVLIDITMETFWMANDKTSPRQTLNMLPVMVANIQDALETSQLTLLNLESMKDRPDILRGKTSEQLVHAHEKQLHQLLVLREQCAHWRRTDYLTPTQKDSLAELERNISLLEKLSQQILFITRHFAAPPIDPMFTQGTITLSGEVFTKQDFGPSVMTAQQQDIMQVVHNRFNELTTQGIERAEIFCMMLDYLPIIDEIISDNDRTAVMDYADKYPGFRDYILLLEEISEKMAGIQFKLMPDA